MSEQNMFLLLLMNNSILDRMQCTKEEKAQLGEIIELFGEMTENSKQIGTHYLKNYINKIDNPFFKTAVMLRLETDSSDFMLHTLLPYVLVSREKGKTFTEKLMILYGITKITEGVHPAFLKTALYSFIGDAKGYESFSKMLD